MKAYSSYTSEENYTLVTSGSFAIKVFGNAIHNKECTAQPYIKYTINGENGEVKGDSATFKIEK